MTEKHTHLSALSSAVTTEDDEHQGLVFSIDYGTAIMSRYCMINGAKSYNVSTIKHTNIRRSNAATARCINNLGINGQYETIPPLVSNSKESVKESKYAYPKWRDTDHTIQSIYIQKALAKRAREQDHNQYAITMRFSPKLAHKIMADGAAHIQEALARQLKRKLGYAPDMWLHLEATVSKEKDKNHNYKVDGKGPVSHSRGVLHMHGAIAITRSDLSTIKRVVRSLNNSTSSTFQNHEVHLDLMHDPLGWVGYCDKDALLNNALLNGVTRYSRTKALGSVAQELYEADRCTHKAKHGTTYGKISKHG